MIELVRLHREALDELCRRFRVQRMDLFGSAVRADFDPARSDLDFLVVFEPCTPSEHYDRYFGLLEALQELFKRRIDLVEPQTVSNPIVRRDIERSRVALYAA
jgi:uncharacterized protein